VRGSRALVFAAAIAAAACGDLDVVTESYGTIGEARQAGAVAPGRVPDGLPAGTTDIREAYNAESGRRWGLFNFPAAEGDQLKALLTADALLLEGQDVAPPRRIEWWPLILRGPLDANAIAATGLRAYRSRGGDLVFAVNWNQGRAYYWSSVN
jgi:hypothetical protein